VSLSLYFIRRILNFTQVLHKKFKSVWRINVTKNDFAENSTLSNKFWMKHEGMCLFSLFSYFYLYFRYFMQEQVFSVTGGNYAVTILLQCVLSVLGYVCVHVTFDGNDHKTMKCAMNAM